MATLRELAGLSQRTEQTSPTTTQSFSIQSQQVQPNQRIDLNVGNVENLIKGASQINAANYQASDYAEKMIANDAYIKMVQDYNAVDEAYNQKQLNGEALTSDDYKNIKEWKQNIYKFHEDSLSNKGFMNENSKEIFMKPAMQLLNKSNSDNATLFIAALKSETADRITSDIENIGSNYTNDSALNDIKSLKALQVRNAEAFVYSKVAARLNSSWSDSFKMGVHSPVLQPYLIRLADENDKSIASLEDVFRAVYNDNYGNFAKFDKNGEFVPVDKNLDVASYESMKKSYTSWFEAIKKSSQNVVNTVATTESFIKNTDTPVSIEEAIKTSNIQSAQIYQMCAGGNKDACNEWQTTRTSLSKMYLKLRESEALHYNYVSYLADGFIDVEDTRVVTPLKNPNGLELTNISSTVTYDDKIKFISSKLNTDYKKSVANGDIEGASKFAVKIAQLNDTGISTTAVSQLTHDIKTASTDGNTFRSARSTDEVLAKLASMTEAKKILNIDAPSINQATYDKLVQFNKDLTTNSQTDKSLTKDKILQKVKLMGQVFTRPKVAGFKDRAAIAKMLGVSESEVNEDNIDGTVIGVVWGKGKAVTGAGDILTRRAIDGEYSDNFEDGSKKITFEIDESILPIWGTNLIGVKPDGMISNTARDNFTRLVMHKLNRFQQTHNIDFSDLVDENKVRIKQTELYVNNKKELVTSIELLDNSGNVSHSALITEDEWKAGVSQSVELEDKKWYNDNIKNIKNIKNKNY